jgi:cytoskeletal protein RodZ
MPQRRMILVVTIVALGAAGIWTWRERPQQPASADATLVSAQAQAPVVESRLSTSSHPDATGSASSLPPTPAASTESSSPAPDSAPSATNTQVDPPDVDTPEPAARKFASGGREPAAEQ